MALDRADIKIGDGLARASGGGATAVISFRFEEDECAR
jgi:hypothetical protein